jgi:hypothetical protein
VFKGGAMSTTGYAYALFARQFVFRGEVIALFARQLMFRSGAIALFTRQFVFKDAFFKVELRGAGACDVYGKLR